jgi:hypothetical protein
MHLVIDVNIVRSGTTNYRDVDVEFAQSGTVRRLPASGPRLSGVRHTRGLTAGAIMVAGLMTSVGAGDASSSTVPPCSPNVLSMRAEASGAAAGNVGTPVLITNHGAASCTLVGFPVVVAHTEARSPRPVTFVHFARSQIFRTVLPRPVVLAHRGTASFGISYVDALDQQYGQGPRCQMNSVTVRFPGLTPVRVFKVTLVANGHDGYGPINSCFAGFELGLTPVVKGPSPPNY